MPREGNIVAIAIAGQESVWTLHSRETNVRFKILLRQFKKSLNINILVLAVDFATFKIFHREIFFAVRTAIRYSIQSLLFLLKVVGIVLLQHSIILSFL